MSSQSVCKACILLEGLNKGLPHLGTQKTKGRGKRRPAQGIHVKLEDEATGPGGQSAVYAVQQQLSLEARQDPATSASEGGSGS